MDLETICRANDISMWACATEMISLIEKGHVTTPGQSSDEAIANLREIAEQHRPSRAT